jgi:hypothetical protein
MVPGLNIRKIQVLIIIFIACGLMAGIVSAAQSDQVFSGVTGYPTKLNQSVWVFGEPCGDTETMISLGVTGVHFAGTPTSGPAPLQVQFSASAGPEITSWSWDFGDGSYGSGMNPVHTYTTPGSYTVKLTERQGGQAIDPESAYFSCGSVMTWQKDGMIIVTGSGSSADLVSSDQKGAVTTATSLITTNTAEQLGLVTQYLPGLYPTISPRKNQTLNFQRGVVSPRAYSLTLWKTGNP